MSRPTPTLVMGASGSIGAHVLADLIARGVPVRASTRNPDAARFPAGVEVVAADLTDPASLSAAFDGVRRVFLYANPHGVDGVIAAARRAGVRQIVLMSSGSVLHPSSRGNAITEEHLKVERAFAGASDLVVVPIRPLVLASNALGWAYPIRARAALGLYRPEAMTAPIHEKDIAAVAVTALTSPPDAVDPVVSGMLTGPARLPQSEQAAMIGAAIGRDVEVRKLERDEALAGFSRFMPADEAAAVIRFLEDAADGNSPATDTVAQVLGRPALGYDAWASDHAADFV